MMTNDCRPYLTLAKASASSLAAFFSSLSTLGCKSSKGFHRTSASWIVSLMEGASYSSTCMHSMLRRKHGAYTMLQPQQHPEVTEGTQFFVVNALSLMDGTSCSSICVYSLWEPKCCLQYAKDMSGLSKLHEFRYRGYWLISMTNEHYSFRSSCSSTCMPGL